MSFMLIIFIYFDIYTQNSFILVQIHYFIVIMVLSILDNINLMTDLFISDHAAIKLIIITK